MGFRKDGNRAIVDISDVQCCKDGPFLNSSQHLWSQKLSTGIFRARQHVFYFLEEFLEVFFTVVTSSGRECLILVNPRLAI